MKSFARVLCLVTCLQASRAGDIASQPVDVARYQLIWQRSPFVVEAPAAQENSPLAQRFVLTAVTVLGDQPMVFVLDRKTLQRIILTTQPSPDGYALISLTTNSDPKLVRANIRVGREQGSIGYDSASLQSLNQPAVIQPSVPPSAPPVVAGTPTPDQTNSAKPPAVKIIRRTSINLSH